MKNNEAPRFLPTCSASVGGSGYPVKASEAFNNPRANAYDDAYDNA